MTRRIACGPSAIRCSGSCAIIVSFVVTFGVPLGRRTPMRDSRCRPPARGPATHPYPIASTAISRRHFTLPDRIRIGGPQKVDVSCLEVPETVNPRRPAKRRFGRHLGRRRPGARRAAGGQRHDQGKGAESQFHLHGNQPAMSSSARTRTPDLGGVKGMRVGGT